MDVRDEDGQKADLDAQQCSPGDASSEGNGDERDVFLCRSGDDSHSIKAAAPTAHLVDMPCCSDESSGPIGIVLASCRQLSVSSPGPRHIILPKQHAEAV